MIRNDGDLDLIDRPTTVVSDDFERELQGAVACDSCESVYRVEERRLACQNCGSPLSLVEDAAVGTQRQYLGAYSFLKGIADLSDQALKAQGIMRDAGGPSAKARTEGSVSCSWCETHYATRPQSPNCNACGGVLPMPVGFDRGPAPPAAPRKLARGFRTRIYVKQNLGGFFGLGAILISLPLMIVTLPVGIILFLLGVVAAHSNFITAYHRCRALQNGTATPGKIEAVHRFGDPANSKPMYRVYFRFEANGKPVRGMKYTYDQAIENHFVGEPVWIVYLSRKPVCYDTWPPLA